MTDPRHPEEDLLVEVALGHADGATRDRVATHLTGCAACRDDYRELADAIELVLPAVPRTAPPAGFGADVLARLRDEQGDGRGAARSPRRRSLLLAVAAGVAGIAVGVGAGAVLLDRPDEPSAVVTAWGSPLVDTSGEAVGTVSPSRDATGPVLVVDVTGGPAGQTVTCRLVLTDGTTQEVGRWPLADGRPNSWVVPVPDAGVVSVEMVAEDGSVWSTADL